jgi:trimethylamine:corrinoid methyltransferase-like protein
MSYAMLVIENEIFVSVGRFLRGIEIDEDRVALDLIGEVGLRLLSFEEAHHRIL